MGKYETSFEEDGIVISPAIISEETEDIQVNKNEDGLAQVDAYEESIEVGGITYNFWNEFQEDRIVTTVLTTPDMAQAQYEEGKVNEHVASAVDLSGEDHKSKIEVGGNDYVKIESPPTPDETSEDKVVEEQISIIEVGGVEYKWKIVTDGNEMEILPLFTPEDIRAQLGCSAYSRENACVKAVDAKSGAKCQWHTDTATGVETCLTEKAEFINTVEIGGVEYKYTLYLPQEEMFSQISDEHGIVDIAGVKEIPEFSPGLRGAMVQ